MKPKVSVLMRSYNQKEFLIEAIESVLIQDYENMEIVVADDASTDGSKDILLEYEKKYPGLFKLALNKNNLGRPGNFNASFKLCAGKYIAILDGDDLFLPGKIKKQVEFMESHPECVMSYHDGEIFESESGKIIKCFNSGPGSYFPYEGQAGIIVQNGWFINNSSVMVLMDACPSHGCDERLPTGEDRVFQIEIAVKGRFAFIPEILGRCRKHENNITRLNSVFDCQINNLIGLAILEIKYPHLAGDCRLYRAKYLYFIGTSKVVDNSGPEARKILWESLRQGWVSWKWFGWYLVSFLGIDTIKRVRNFVIKT